MPIKALMIDVDGVLVDGRPDDGRPWHTHIHEDLGLTYDALQKHFFAPHWERIVVGRAGMTEHLATALRAIAPHVDPATLTSYWFERDSRLVTPLLDELAELRATGIRVYLATNQEHLRARYLMETLGLARHVDEMFYSARLGTKKPDRDFFARVQAAVALNADEMLLVDDTRQNVDAARDAGWHALHWTKQSTPDVIRDLCR